MKKLWLIVLLVPGLVNAQQKLSENNYRVYSVKQAKEVSLNDIADDMKAHDVLFFGEEHNDSVTHYLERAMLELMYEKFKENVALSMEMFERDVQPVMDEYLKGYIREKHFTKDARAWSNYRDYKPMVEFAKEKGMDVVCANAAGRYTNIAGRKGQKALMELPDASKRFFAPLPYDTAQGEYYKKLTGLADHGPSSTTDTAKAKPMPAMEMGNFNLVMAQSLWDATMAYSVSQYLKQHKGRKVMQVNGKFHSDEGFAVATQLKKYSPKATRLIIHTVSDDSFPGIRWDDYKKMGDYIIITDPKVPRTYKE
ncbi:MAG: hypothetical protein K0Q79_1142 [Flavipsychrobacter sp.]|jgi:uncharacterized iron-regulated protein|nr:hypothetical protein [Flavipsychrobacter sp.]